MTISTYIGVSLLLAVSTFCLKTALETIQAFRKKQKEELNIREMANLRNRVEGVEIACIANEYALRRVAEIVPEARKSFSDLIMEAYAFAKDLKRGA